MRFAAILTGAAVLALCAPLQADEIVVTGKSLRQTAADLEACIKAKCPPDKDVAATLAHAENQFVSGDYKGSRTTLKQSLGRNRKHGGNYPVPVSDLLRANSKIAEQVGEPKDFQLSTLDMRDTLRAAFGPDHPRSLSAQIAVGDSRVKLGFADDGDRIYRDVETRAIGAKQYGLATLARLRQALVMRMRYEAQPDASLRRKLDEQLDQISLHPLPGAEDFALAAEVMRARLDRSAGNEAATAALIRRFAETRGVNRPMLLHSEPLSRIDFTKDPQSDSMAKSESWHNFSSNSQGSWADIGFWIGPDGRVTDIEVLRKRGSSTWLKPVQANIAARVYAPLKRDDTAPGFYMIERYTLTARIADDVTGTHLRMREAVPRVEMIDLTPEDYSQPPKSG